MTTVLGSTDITRILSHQVTLPPKQRWTRRALARHLRSLNLMGADYHTLDNWERDRKLFRGIKDFRREIPLDEKGNYLESFPFTAYQAWVIVKVAYILTSLRDDLRGCEYLPLVARTLANKEIQNHFLSRDIWLYEISEAA
ncbi:MAG TPA: hypothetical protein V6D37_15000 [Candidatus Sericytochromatia bacterium]